MAYHVDAREAARGSSAERPMKREMWRARRGVVRPMMATVLVGASILSAAPVTVSAIPAFSRQTGSACLGCHFQEVPALNPFGRAFKAGAFTDVGDQALVEDGDLSIPAALNASMVVRAQAGHRSGVASSMTYTIPADSNLLIAGRIGANSGAFVEFQGGNGDTGGGINNVQLMNSRDVGGFRFGVGFANTSFGGDAVMNVSNVYGQHSHGVGDLGGAVGAINHSGFTNSMSAIGAWIGNDMGYVQLALIAPGGAAGWIVGHTANSGVNMTGALPKGQFDMGLKMAKLVRAAATLDAGGWDAVIGFGVVAGKVGKTTNTAVTSVPEMNMMFVDAQAQGRLGGMPLGVYADYAHARGKPNGNLLGAQDVRSIVPLNSLLDGNILNALGGTPGPYNALGAKQSFTAFSIRATLSPLPRLTLGAGYGYRKTRDSGPAVISDQPLHQVFSLAVSYQLYQNSIVSANLTNDNLGGLAPYGLLKESGAGRNGNTRTFTLDWLTLM